MPDNTLIQDQDNQALRYQEYRDEVEAFDINQEFMERFGGGRDGEADETAEFQIPNEAVSQETKVKDPVSIFSNKITVEEALAFNPLESTGGVDTVIKIIKDIGKGTLETPKQLLSGSAEAANEALQLAEEIGEELIGAGLPSSFLQIVNEKGEFDIKFFSKEETTQAREAGEIELFQLPEGAKPESVTGTLVRETSKFLIGFLPATRAVKALRGTKAATTTFGEAAVASSLASAIVQDPHEDRLSAYLDTVPGLSAIVPDYLADNNPENESVWEGRLKNAIEDAVLGVFAESLFRVFKFYKAQRKIAALEAKESNPMDRAILKEQVRESAVQQAEEIPPEALRALGDPASDKMFQRIGEAEKRVKDETGIPAAQGDIFINMARIDTPDDVRKLIKDVADADAPAINKKRGGAKKTLGKMIEESDQEFLDIKDLIGRDPGAMTAAQAIAARKILTSSGDQLIALARLANSHTATQADLYAFRRGLSVHYAIQSEVIAARTETARALRSWAIPVGTDRQRGEAITELIGTGGGTKTAKEMAQSIVDASDNPTALNAMVKDYSRSSLGKALYQVWIDGILSGPHTAIVNALGNSITATYMIPESLANAAISKVFYEGEVSFLETSARAFGLAKGIRDGFRLVANGQKAGEIKELSEQFEQFVKFEGVGQNNISAEAFDLSSSGAIGQGIDYLGKFFNISGTVLNTTDRFFKSIGYRMELEALALRQGVGEGLEGGALASRVVDIVNNPPASLKAEAVSVAHHQTFTQPFGETGRSGVRFLRRIPGSGFVVPFVRTPTNIMKYTFKRTPLARFARSVKADMAAGGSRAAQAWGRIGLGSMIMLGIADMTLDGTITGAGPENRTLRSNLMLTGWRPFSAKIGNTYFPYNRLDPVGNLVAYGASFGEIINNMDDPDAEFAAVTGVMGFSQNLASKSYLSGIFDFIAAVDPSNPTKSPGDWLGRFSTSLIPKSSLVRSIARSIDPTFRITETAAGDPALADLPEVPAGIQVFMQDTLNRFKANIPGLSKDLPPRRDLWGEEITRPSHLGTAWDLLSPIYASEGKYDQVEQILVNNKIPVGHVSNDIQGVKLTTQERSDYMELAGKPLKEFLDKKVKTPGFKRMTDGPDGMKSQYIQSYVRAFRKAAAGKMIRSNLSLRNRILAKQANDRSKLIDNPTPDLTLGAPALPVIETPQPGRSLIDQLGGR